MTVAFGRSLDSRTKSPSFQSLSQNFQSHNTCSDGLTGTAPNWLEPGYFSQGGKSVDILPNHAAAFCLYWLWCRRQCHVDFLPASDWAVYAGYYFWRYFSVIGLVGSVYIMQQVDGPFDHSYEFTLRFAFASSLVAALAFGFEYCESRWNCRRRNWGINWIKNIACLQK